MRWWHSYRICVSARNCDGDVTTLVIALFLWDISIKLNLRHKRMLKYWVEVGAGYWCGTLEEKDHSEDIDVDMRIGLLCILKK
jgi:hypothetical protein